jgi:uncharacterized protein (TIGR04141 family)
LAVPEVIDWADVKGFRFGQAKKAALEADIHLADYVTSVRDLESLTVKRLRQNRVVGISASTDLATYEWPVYKCLYAELDTSSGSYVLDNGKWYKVDTDIVRDVERELKGISVSGLKLPRYKLGEGEPGYNKHAVSTKPNAYALMDRKLIPFGGGRSKIEFCDIYVKGNAMIHVKRYGGSNTLSYLFNQGVVAASLFLWDSRFRKELNQRLPTSHQLTNPAVRPKAESFEVAFGIISQSRSKLVLPFFSRVALRNAYRTLSSFGYRVTCTKIDFE